MRAAQHIRTGMRRGPPTFALVTSPFMDAELGAVITQLRKIVIQILACFSWKITETRILVPSVNRIDPDTMVILHIVVGRHGHDDFNAQMTGTFMSQSGGSHAPRQLKVIQQFNDLFPVRNDYRFGLVLRLRNAGQLNSGSRLDCRANAFIVIGNGAMPTEPMKDNCHAEYRGTADSDQ